MGTEESMERLNGSAKKVCWRLKHSGHEEGWEAGLHRRTRGQMGMYHNRGERRHKMEGICMERKVQQEAKAKRRARMLQGRRAE